MLPPSRDRTHHIIYVSHKNTVTVLLKNSIRFSVPANSQSEPNKTRLDFAELLQRTFIIDEMHVDARFDIIKNKGFWLNDNNEKEIDNVDWFTPDASDAHNPYATQPYNPNLLTLTTGCSSCGRDEKVHIRK